MRLKSLKRWLILGHRWLGIATGLFLAAWVLSGLVMLYVAFPALTEAERLSHLAPIAWDRVRLGPAEVMDRAGLEPVPGGLSLSMWGEAPVYQVSTRDGARHAVSAETGQVLGPVDAAAALAPFGPGATVRAVTRDQWTVRDRYDPLRPFHVVTLGDAAGTELYVSARTGAVVLDTSRRERLWNWLGAIPHWFYPTPLRARAELWRGVLLWVSGVAVAGVLGGLVLGIWRLRLRRPYASGAVTPYRGLGRWHHLLGTFGGLSLLTFVASGWLSMNPNHWFTPRTPPAAMREAYAGPLVRIDRAALDGFPHAGIVEVRFTQVDGRSVLVAADAGGRRVATPSPPEETLRAAAARALPEARIAGTETLTAYDAYWYPHHDTRPLPVLRVRFDDAAATWLHIDPETGALLDRLDASGRLQRWLFEAPHRLDFGNLFQARPAWDVVMWLLNGLGAGIALSGVVMGWRRLRHAARAR